ncbi:MAG TPA: flagellin [Terriglobales bacterium]|nr:flagellin [Terriglobales bacterium]
MALSILNNIPSLAAQNQLSITGSGLQKTLFRLSSGSRINSGADDAAGLAIADGLRANISALSQSSRNATDGIGKLQVADGALAQVSNLLNRAVTLATEAATGTVSSGQRNALHAEFDQIRQEIDRIGTDTTFNGDKVFQQAGTTTDTNSFSRFTVCTSSSGSRSGRHRSSNSRSHSVVSSFPRASAPPSAAITGQRSVFNVEIIWSRRAASPLATSTPPKLEGNTGQMAMPLFYAGHVQKS